MDEKKISEVTVRLSDTIRRDAQDVAAFEDRTLSEVIRRALELYLYGHKMRADTACGKADSCAAKRGG